MKVLLATFHEEEPAQQLKARLNQASIEASVHNDSRLQRVWLVPKPRAAFHVEVLQPDFQKAMHLLQEWDRTENVLARAVRCPACHSPRVEFPQLTRKFVLPSFGSLLMALGLLQREFYCVDCHYTWPTAIPLEPPRDHLGWPERSKLWHPGHSPKH